jgi:hypothetical protein
LLDVESPIVDGKHVALGGMETSIERFGQQCRKSVEDDLRMSITAYSLAEARNSTALLSLAQRKGIQLAHPPRNPFLMRSIHPPVAHLADSINVSSPSGTLSQIRSAPGS